MTDTRTFYEGDDGLTVESHYDDWKYLQGVAKKVQAKWYCDNTFVEACTSDDPHGPCHWAIYDE